MCLGVVEVDEKMIEVTDEKPAKPSKRKLTQEIEETGGDRDAVDAIRRKYGYNPRWTNYIMKAHKWRKRK